MPTTEVFVNRIIVVNNTGIPCYFREHSIHIENHINLQNLLKDSSEYAFNVALKCKDVFREINGRDFNVSDGSMSVEILGHVYPDKLAHNLANWIPAAAHLARYITDHTSIIDIGEPNHDDKRWVWDSLAPYLGSITELLG
ncbi:hypothetical protein [Clostridium saccharoperbutylacetonicum]|uniref:hypothetical protein n=1 Tax=Clostridium saccharoperbutylacetonicum TaxID=36745 RepID=UPI000983B291|nr:hypothetical protein [Clostridium saccharoperbutylacetonicum]AQR95537.1 hypothetical protein CLSAP_28530 [Clostridium saccharoperbutylacetonicum]NSB31397.1 hypothetical protein [Clostridium saccharoperbutylacetonicum]